MFCRTYHFEPLFDASDISGREYRLVKHPPPFLKLCEIWNAGIVFKTHLMALSAEKFSITPTVTHLTSYVAF